jgi:group I intron endonuclease
MIVYLITNLVNGKFYVGRTRLTLAKRWGQHVRDAAAGHEQLLQRAIRKYGQQSFSMSILGERETLSEICALEMEKIAELKTLDHSVGYNMTPGGDGGTGLYGPDHPMFGKRHTAETRLKMRLARLGKPHPHHKNQCGCKNPFYGHHQNAAQRAAAFENIKRAGESNRGWRRTLFPVNKTMSIVISVDS